MENSTSVWSSSKTPPLIRETTDEITGLIQVEQTLFLSCITVVSALAIPPNLLMLHLSIQVPQSRAGKRNSLSVRCCRVTHLPLLLMSQIVSNLLISFTAPLDVLFLVHGGRDEVSCVLFLSIKSVVMLFSVLVVCLQGLDKVYRVQNLHKMFLKNQAGRKLLAIAVSVVLSTVPLILHLILTEGQPLKDGCRVLPEVVDVTESIFFLGFTLSSLSLVAVVIMLRKHKQKVSVSDGENVTVISVLPRVLASSRLPSVSEAITEPNDNRSVEAGTLSTEAPTTPAAQEHTSPSAVTIAPRSLNNDNMHLNTASPSAISLQQSSTKRQTSIPSVTGSLGHHLSPVESESFFQANDANQSDAPAQNSGSRVPGVPGVTRGSKSGRGSIKGSVRWSTSTEESEEGGGKPSESTLRSHRSRTLSTSSATQRRLELATVTAVKRGALSLVIFLVCYIPLMVALLILSLDHPVYETALLLEGLTLPISYVHALVSPLLAMRVDKEWREQTAVLLRRLFQCCGKIWPR
ncbi:hypothetical protein ACOMHN_017706 [Nucella lapillus]